MLNGESLYFSHVIEKGKRIWVTVVSPSLGTGGEICKEMFANVRWSTVHNETSIQISPHLMLQ